MNGWMGWDVMYVCACMYVHMHVRTYVRMHVFMYMGMWVCSKISVT